MLFLIMDPLGNIPVFLSVLSQVPAARRMRVLVRELLIALVALFAFLWLGQYLLTLLHLKQQSVSIAGGIILFLIALKMIFPPPKGAHQEELDGEPFVVPLAIPFVAGPSILASILLLVSHQPARMSDWSMALFGAWVATAGILLASAALRRVLGKRGLIAMERLMGMLLIALAVQMFLDGVVAYR